MTQSAVWEIRLMSLGTDTKRGSLNSGLGIYLIWLSPPFSLPLHITAHITAAALKFTHFESMLPKTFKGSRSKDLFG